MDYRLDLRDAAGRRIARFDTLPLLDAVREAPDGVESIRGLIPADIPAVAPGYTAALYLDGVLFCAAPIRRVTPYWGDLRRLILEQYVNFHELLEIDAYTEPRRGNTPLSARFLGTRIDDAVREVINRAPGPLHYTVAHGAYPDGAQREWAKFAARKTGDNALGIGSIATGQWVSSPRLDASGAYAKDGDTIAGLVVDGVAWPDVRLMLIDCEETTRNSHAIARHPEVATWSDARYAASGYALRAETAKAALQQQIDTHGIDHIELNPHRDYTGAYDDRVDAYGRYLALLYGGGECHNAAMVELGHAEVYLYDEGRYHEPALALKEFYSYTGAHTDSIAECAATLAEFEVNSGALEALTALAYCAGGYVYSVSPEQRVAFAPAAITRVLRYDPLQMAVARGSDSTQLANRLVFRGNPYTAPIALVQTRAESIAAYSDAAASFDHYGIGNPSDAEVLLAGLLDDLAYPASTGELTIYRGDAALRAGDIVELRGAPLREVSPRLAEAWGGRFAGRLVARVRRLRHRITGRTVHTDAWLTAPLRSVADPLAFITRSQERGTELFQFRLDDPAVGCDLYLRLDA